MDSSDPRLSWCSFQVRSISFSFTGWLTFPHWSLLLPLTLYLIFQLFEGLHPSLSRSNSFLIRPNSSSNGCLAPHVSPNSMRRCKMRRGLERTIQKREWENETERENVTSDDRYTSKTEMALTSWSSESSSEKTSPEPSDIWTVI